MIIGALARFAFYDTNPQGDIFECGVRLFWEAAEDDMENKLMMNIDTQKVLVNGYGWTGSSALVQMLAEYEGVGSIPNEFDDFRVPGGIGDVIDLKMKNQAVTFGSSRRFDCMKKYILPFFIRGCVSDKLWPKSFRGASTSSASARGIALNYIKEYFLYRRCIKQISIADDGEEVFSEAAQWIEDVVNLYSDGSRHAVFDQPILFDCYLDYWPKVFSGAKLILVSRNPLDQMGSVLIDGKHLLEAPNWSVRFLYGRDAYTNRSLEFFMETTLQRYKYISETYDRLGDQNMLVVQFENLVNSYQKTKGEIETFLGLDPADHASPLSNFRPDESREGLISRGGLCDRTKAKAQEMEKQYQNMIDHTKAI